MTTLSRVYKVEYGGTTIGGTSTSYYIDGEPRIAKNYRRMRVEFTAIVSGASAGDFTTKSEALEALFRLPHQDLTVTLGSDDQEFSETDNTGLNITPSIELSRSAVATDRSRSYDCVIELELPADRPGDAGLRDSVYSIAVGPNGQRILRITGQYSALLLNKARAQYDDSIEDYENTIKAAVDPAAKWDILERTAEPDKEDANCDFVSVLEEIIYQQAVGEEDVPELKSPRLEATPAIVYDGFALIGVKRPMVIDVAYEANVDKAVTVDLITLYTSKIRPLMIDYAEAAAAVGGGATGIIQAETPAFAPTANTVRASIRILIPDAGIFAADVQDEIDIGPPFRLIPVVSTKAYAAKGMPSFAVATRKITSTVTILGDRRDAYDRALALAKVIEALADSAPTLPTTLADFTDRHASIALDALPEPALSAGGQWIQLAPKAVFGGPVYVGENGVPVTTCILTIFYQFAEDPGPARPITTSGGASGNRITTVERNP